MKKSNRSHRMSPDATRKDFLDKVLKAGEQKPFLAPSLLSMIQTNDKHPGSSPPGGAILGGSPVGPSIPRQSEAASPPESDPTPGVHPDWQVVIDYIDDHVPDTSDAWSQQHLERLLVELKRKAVAICDSKAANQGRRQLEEVLRLLQDTSVPRAESLDVNGIVNCLEWRAGDFPREIITTVISKVQQIIAKINQAAGLDARQRIAPRKEQKPLLEQLDGKINEIESDLRETGAMRVCIVAAIERSHADETEALTDKVNDSSAATDVTQDRIEPLRIQGNEHRGTSFEGESSSAEREPTIVELPPSKDKLPETTSPPVKPMVAVESSGDSVDSGIPGQAADPKSESTPCQSWSEFSKSHWISPSGKVEIAPWTMEDWSVRITNAFHTALRGGDLWLSYIYCRAAEDSNVSLPTPSGAIEHLLSGRSDLTDSELAEHVGCKVCCVALAMHGACPLQMDPEELVTAARFKSQPLRSALIELLKISRAGSPAISTVSQQLQQAPKERIEKRIERLQSELAEWSAAITEYRSIAAVIHQTHCREAWEAWMGTWRPSFEALSSAVQDLILKGSFIDGALVRSKKMANDAKKTFDKMEAKYQSRGKMDKRSASLLRLYDDLWDHAVAFQQSTKGEQGVDVDHDAWLRMRDEVIPEPLEKILRDLVASRVYRDFENAVPGLVLSEPVVYSRPHVLGGMTPEAAVLFLDKSQSRALPDLTVEMINPQWVASNLLHEGCQAVSDGFSADQQQWVGNVVANLARHARMHALASRLIGGMSQVGTELQELQRRTNEAVIKSREACVSLKYEIQALRGLADPEHERPLHDCELIIGGFETGLFPGTGTSPRFPEPSLVDAWCSSTKAWVNVRISLQVDRIRECITRIGSVSDRKAAEAALSEKRYVAAIAISQTGTSNQITARYRSTMWRDEAERDLNGDTAASHTDNSDDRPIVDDWKAWNQARSSGKQAHTIIVDLLRRDFAGQTAELKSGKAKATLAAVQLLELLNKSSRDRACHLPELHDFDNIVLVSCAHPYASETFARDVYQYLKSQATEGRSIAVCVAPRIPSQVRASAINWMQDKSFFGAIIDDTDFWRLTYCDNRLAGLIECIFEQLRLGLLHPFSMVDGSKMRIEVFVGRREQARDIAETLDISRIFSGRKLGKSALLRYVSDTYDGHKLTSGKTLDVVYIQILGLENELTILEKISCAFSERYGVTLDQNPIDQKPFERLNNLINKFSKKKPDNHILFVLDEADEFVRSQLESIYQKGTNQNQTLSMAMSRAYHSVRFLVAGYVTTNTSDGPWINWGRILRLRPLDESDGCELVAAPLAKIGIDASGVADSAAFLCGYQPAIIHAFGRSLIESLDKRMARTPGSRPRISSELADSIFHSIDVQSEIRNVTLNNFQDDLAARAVFLAIIHAFHDLPAFEPIYDAVSVIINSLISIGGDDLSWLGSDPRGRIDRLLTTFVERNLLNSVKNTKSLAAGYSLKFPHHLPTLWSSTIERDIQRQIAALAKSAEANLPLPRSLDGQSLRDIVELAKDGLEGLFQRAIIASQWPELYSGIDGSCGIKSCEGIDAVGGHITENASLDHIRSHRDSPDVFKVFIGGPSIIRSTRDSDYIPFLGRLSRGLFERRLARDRGILFDDASLREQLYALTAGIPAICMCLDDDLTNECSISNDSLQRILDSKDSIYRSAWQVISNASSLGLADSELDLLQRICAIHDGELDGPNIQAVLSDAEMLKSFCGNAHPDMEPIDTNRRKDQLIVLLRLGLLPISPASTFSEMLPWESLGKVPMDDPIRVVINQRAYCAD